MFQVFFKKRTFQLLEITDNFYKYLLFEVYYFFSEQVHIERQGRIIIQADLKAEITWRDATADRRRPHKNGMGSAIAKNLVLLQQGGRQEFQIGVANTNSMYTIFLKTFLALGSQGYLIVGFWSKRAFEILGFRVLELLWVQSLRALGLKCLIDLGLLGSRTLGLLKGFRVLYLDASAKRIFKQKNRLADLMHLHSQSYQYVRSQCPGYPSNTLPVISASKQAFIHSYCCHIWHFTIFIACNEN